MVGRSIANIYDLRRYIYRGAKRRGKYMSPRSYIEAMDLPTVLYTIYYGECATDEPFA